MFTGVYGVSISMEEGHKNHRETLIILPKVKRLACNRPGSLPQRERLCMLWGNPVIFIRVYCNHVINDALHCVRGGHSPWNLKIHAYHTLPFLQKCPFLGCQSAPIYLALGHRFANQVVSNKSHGSMKRVNWLQDFLANKTVPNQRKNFFLFLFSTLPIWGYSITT